MSAAQMLEGGLGKFENFLFPADKVPDVVAAKNRATKIIAALALAAVVLLIVMIVLSVEIHKLKHPKKSGFKESQGIDRGVRTSDPNNQQTNLVNHGVGSYAIHQGSVATGGLFEHDIESVWQEAPMRTSQTKANAHCEPHEIEGVSFVTDVATGNKVRVVSCYDHSGIHIPKIPTKQSKSPIMLPGRGMPKQMAKPMAKSGFEGFESENFSSNPSMDCNGVWDYGAEGELGSQVLMSNMVAYNSMGEGKLEQELLDME